MKTLIAIALIHLAFALLSHADESERVLPFSLRSSRGYEAALTDFTPKELKYCIGTAVAIRDAGRRIIFRDRSTLYRDRAVNAEWSPSGEFFVIAVVNGEGHFPYRHAIYIFSLRDSRLHMLKVPASAVFISGKIAFRSPNLVRLIAGFYHKLPPEAMDHPKAIFYDLSRIPTPPNRRKHGFMFQP